MDTTTLSRVSVSYLDGYDETKQDGVTRVEVTDLDGYNHTEQGECELPQWIRQDWAGWG